MKMQIDFSGKRVLVTDGVRGIGRGAVEGFLDHGATVAVHGADQANVDGAIEELGGGYRLIAVAGDLTSAAGCKQVVAQAVSALGGLDILVNAAAYRDDKRFEEVTPDDWDQALSGSLKPALFCTQQATPALRESKGSVVNIASILGLMGGPAGSSAYSAAMGSVVNLTRMSALRVGVDGIRINCLCPGTIEGTGEGEALTIGRLGTIDDMTGTILFLSSSYAGFMTGSIIVNDGGKYGGS